ncbi:unnamed protein product [Clonostachys byssicola]|uniref:Uncharacterized protein n=1 Tax=Clonostachys byssicola TaxID=160290 RepID=A0A9N9UXU4_9HYPO|nr:unnamed protein product [Clonostachys byssicola]
MPAIDSDIDQVQLMFDVNVFGPMRMVRNYHPMVIRAHGIIVNIGSIGGISPFVYGSAYNATKAAVQHWSNTLRVEMSPFRHVCYSPEIIAGEIGTNILKRDRSRELPEGQPLTFNIRKLQLISQSTIAGSYFSALSEEFKSHVNRVPGKPQILGALDNFQSKLTVSNLETTDRFEYARAVVGESLKNSPTSWFWYGSWARFFRFLNAFFPRTIFVFYLAPSRHVYFVY